MGNRDFSARNVSRNSAPNFDALDVPFTQLAASKQYTQIVETIAQLGQRVEDPTTAVLLTAVQQLCVICQQGEEAITQQRDTLAQAVAYQQTCQEQLATILRSLPVTRPDGRSPQVVIEPAAPVAERPFKPATHTAESSEPRLTVYMMGDFRLYQNDRLVEACSNGKAMAILKYLLLHRRQPVAKEVLMDLFWPESEPDSARNSLNVAIFSLRKMLRQGCEAFSHIVFRNNAYRLNHEMAVWVDIEEFTEKVQEGERLENQGEWETAVSVYQSAEVLWQGEFLTEERYEDWVTTHRTHLHETYLQLLEKLCHYYFEKQLFSLCIATCQKLLAIEPCYEEAHRWLMTSYYQQGQRNLALRQYHRCQAALAEDLAVEPMPETVDLYEQIRCAA